MKEALAWVRDAIATKDIATALNHYLVDQGIIYAADGRMTAAHPFPHDGTFCVSGPEFDALLGRMDAAPKIEVGQGAITAKLGRMRGTIKTIDPRDWTYATVPDPWHPLPLGLLEGLRKLRPFISDNAVHSFAMCVLAKDDALYATTNVSLARCLCPGLNGVAAMVPYWAVDFILKREEGLVEWAHGDGYLGFRWSNGAWMRTQLVADRFPDTAITMLDGLPQPTVEITLEWRAAFDHAKALLDETIVFKPDHMTGVNRNMAVHVEASTPAPQGAEHSAWTLRYLAPVVECATHWQPDAWPNPSPFVGPGIVGLVAGRRG